MTQTIYHSHKDKYLDLFEKFMTYISVYKTDVEIPKNANIVMFDYGDENFSRYSVTVRQRLRSKNKHVVEVTRTGSKDLPWMISAAL